MAKRKTTPAKPDSQLKKLEFLIGSWHTQGEVLQAGSKASLQISGMDTYEWISSGCFILHRVDVFMGTVRTEAVEIIGYDESRKFFFMKSFDNQGAKTLMYAFVEKAGVLKFGDNKMKSVLSVSKGGNTMHAKWEQSKNGKDWEPWMKLEFKK